MGGVVSDIVRTPYGFLWRDGEPLEVSVAFNTDRHRCVLLQCGKKWVQVYVSPTGRSFRVFTEKHVELKEVPGE